MIKMIKRIKMIKIIKIIKMIKMIKMIIWFGLVWSAGKHLEWDEAVITSVATEQPNKQLPDYSASPDFLLDLLDFLKSGDWQYQSNK